MRKDDVIKGDIVTFKIKGCTLTGVVVKILTHHFHIERGHGTKEGVTTHKVTIHDCTMTVRAPRPTYTKVRLNEGAKFWKEVTRGWTPPKPTAGFTPKPFGVGDWLTFEHDGLTYRAQVADDGILIVEVPGGPNELTTFVHYKGEAKIPGGPTLARVEDPATQLALA